MTGHINRHNLQDYLNFYFIKWPEIEKSINASLDERVKLENSSLDSRSGQESAVVNTK